LSAAVGTYGLFHKVWVIKFLAHGLVSSGSLGIEMSFNKHRIKKDSPAYFYERECSGLLLIPNPAKAGPADFFEKNFQ